MERDNFDRQRMQAPKAGSIKGLSHRYTKTRNIGGPPLEFYNEDF